MRSVQLVKGVVDRLACLCMHFNPVAGGDCSDKYTDSCRAVFFFSSFTGWVVGVSPSGVQVQSSDGAGRS